MRKVLFVIHYPPPYHGSAVVGGLIKESPLINSSFECRYINLGMSANIEEIGRNSPKKFFRYVSLVWQVKRQLLAFRPQLCYFTPTAKGAGFYKDAPIILLVKLFGVKTVFHYHNKGVSTRHGKLIDNLLYRLIFRNSRVILLSRGLYQDIRKYVPENRVYYCPNGLPGPEDAGQKKKDTSADKVTEILFISHLIRSKGVLVLLDACSLLRDMGVRFHCTIAGGNAELTNHEVEDVIVQKRLSYYVSVVGPVHGEEKAALIHSADILAHPSYEDCQPLVILEAMQYALPVVSTHEGAIPDMIADGVTGFLVPRRDSEALADRLQMLIRDPDLRIKMGQCGREKYEKEFTINRFEGRMKEILEKIMTESES